MEPNASSNSRSQILYSITFFAILLSIFYFLASPAALAGLLTISPPLVTLIPRDLGNNEIWYVGGSASVPNAEVVIYLQSESSETMSFTTLTNEKGEWFYSHTTFLRPGDYKT